MLKHVLKQCAGVSSPSQVSDTRDQPHQSTSSQNTRDNHPFCQLHWRQTAGSGNSVAFLQVIEQNHHQSYQRTKQSFTAHCKIQENRELYFMTAMTTFTLHREKWMDQRFILLKLSSLLYLFSGRITLLTLHHHNRLQGMLICTCGPMISWHVDILWPNY